MTGKQSFLEGSISKTKLERRSSWRVIGKCTNFEESTTIANTDHLDITQSIPCKSIDFEHLHFSVLYFYLCFFLFFFFFSCLYLNVLTFEVVNLAFGVCALRSRRLSKEYTLERRVVQLLEKSAVITSLSIIRIQRLRCHCHFFHFVKTHCKTGKTMIQKKGISLTVPKNISN